jgi:hypothetical protein
MTKTSAPRQFFVLVRIPKGSRQHLRTGRLQELAMHQVIHGLRVQFGPDRPSRERDVRSLRIDHLLMQYQSGIWDQVMIVDVSGSWANADEAR